MLCDGVFQTCVLHLRTALFITSAAGIVCIYFHLTLHRQVYLLYHIRNSVILQKYRRELKNPSFSLWYTELCPNHGMAQDTTSYIETIGKQLQTVLGRHHYYLRDLHWWIHDNFGICSNSSKTIVCVFGISLGDTLFLKSMWHIKAVGQNSIKVWKHSAGAARGFGFMPSSPCCSLLDHVLGLDVPSC